MKKSNIKNYWLLSMKSKIEVTTGVSHHHQSFSLFWEEQRKSGKKQILECCLWEIQDVDRNDGAKNPVKTPGEAFSTCFLQTGQMIDHPQWR